MIIRRVGKQPGRAVTQTGQEPASLAGVQCPQLCLTLATEDRAWEEPDLSLSFARPAHRTEGREHRLLQRAAGGTLVSHAWGAGWTGRPLSVSLGQQAREADGFHDSEGLSPLLAVQK